MPGDRRDRSVHSREGAARSRPSELQQPWEFVATERWLRQNPAFARLVDRLPMALLQVQMMPDGWAEVHYLSKYIEDLFGMDRQTMLENGDRLTRSRIHPDDMGLHNQLLLDAAQNLTAVDHDVRYLRGPDDEIWLHLHLAPEAVDGSVLFHGYVYDVTERKLAELRVDELAHHDSLTGLPNRRTFVEQLNAAIARHAANGTLGGLLFVDLDNFKQLNDSQGHSTGDAFLVETGARILNSLGPGDLAARLGGDEFAIIVEADAVSPEQAAEVTLAVAQRLLDTMHEGFVIGALRHIASASIGAVVLDGAQPPEECLRRVDIAMYHVKHTGKSSVALYDTADGDSLRRRYARAIDFRDAVNDHQLELHLQPQVDAHGVIYGAEVLVRWPHPHDGLLLPNDFIDLAEEFGLWSQAQIAVIEDGIGILRAWSDDDSLSRLSVAVNIDAETFVRGDFVDVVSDLVLASGIVPGRLTLELTESVFARDHKQLAANMSALHLLGVRMSLDDFGSGYSSLGYLADLPFQELKIDGQFVRELLHTERHLSIVRAIIAMADSLGLHTVAEYVETEEQRDLLLGLGCDAHQGYLYGRPMPLDQFESLVTGQRSR